MFVIMILLPVLFLFVANATKSTSLPEYFKVPSFELIDQNNKKFLSKEMLGEIWMVNFFFTECKSVCPMQISKIKNFKNNHPQIKIKTISFTVDPNNDTVEKLSNYGKDLSINSEEWKLLTGPEETVRNVVVEGFKSGMDIIEERGIFDIAHANYILIVDKNGFVREIVGFDEKDFEEKIISIYKNLK